MRRHRAAARRCAWSPTSPASRPPRSRTCSRGAAAADPASPSTRPQRVHAAARELNYRPNRAARTIRTGRSDTVQLSLHMLSDPWSLAVAAAVNDEANRHGLTTLILADGDWYAALDRVESDVAYLDGAVDTDDGKRKLADARRARPAARRVLRDARARRLRRDPLRRDPRLLPRDGPPARAAHGDRMPRRPRARSGPTGRSRYTPYVERMRSQRTARRSRRTPRPSPRRRRARSPQRSTLLSQPERPTAIYATTDFAAIAAINAAHMLGLRVPHDVAVIGVGNTPDARLVSPTLTTVGPNRLLRAAGRDHRRPRARVPTPRSPGSTTSAGRSSWAARPISTAPPRTPRLRERDA